MAWCEGPGDPKTWGSHKRTCRPYALIPRGRRPYHPSLKGTEDPRDVAKQNGSAAGGTRVATVPEGAGTECDRDLGPCTTEGTCTGWGARLVSPHGCRPPPWRGPHLDQECKTVRITRRLPAS